MIWMRRPFSAPRVVPGPPAVENPWRSVPPVLTDDEGYEWPTRSIDTRDPEFLATKAAFERLVASTDGLR